MSVKDSSNNGTKSFVTEVLASAGQLEKDDLSAKLGKMSNRLQQVKVEVYEDLRQKYEVFNPDPSLQSAQGLSARVTDLQQSMDDMANKIEKEIKSQLNVSTAEFQSLSSQAKEMKKIQAMLMRLSKCNELIESIDKDLEHSNYVAASSHLKEMRAVLDEYMPENSPIDIVPALHKKFVLFEQELDNRVSETWSQAVKWNVQSVAPAKKNDKVVKKTVELCIDTKKKEVLSSAAQTLYHLDLLNAKLTVFAERFCTHFVKPIASNPKTKVVVSEDPFKITVHYSLKPDTNVPVQPMTAFTNLSNVLTPLNKHLLDISVGAPKEKLTLMQLLGEKLCGEFIDIVTKETLAPAIPSNQQDLEAFQDVVSFTKIFQQTLASMQFLQKEDTRLTDYFGNVNALFANKRCQEILEKGRELMCSEIHNMVQVDSDHPYGSNVPILAIGGSKKAKMAENMALANETTLSGDSFKLPKCYVSESVVALLELAYSSMEEACSSEPACAVQLFYCVRNMFELYCTAVPTYHKENLATLPQLAALHHNNCEYIAHFLLTLGHQYSSRLQGALASPGACTFVDLVPQFRRLATECFLAMMRSQRDQIVKTIDETQCFASISDPENLGRAERAVKQVLYQLQRLASVWGQVLPVNIYCKAMGTLLNVLLEGVVKRVVMLEDLSVDDASHLSTLMEQILERGPRLLQPSDSQDPTSTPQKLVPKWTKFSQLLFALNAGLREIDSGWGEGRFSDFQPAEMRQLIRALFQNTTQRDRVLVSIK